MSRALYIVACALTLAGCSGSAPNWSFFGSGTPAPEQAGLRLDSDPPGAEAKSSLGPSCRTPCTLPTAEVNGDFAVTMTLKGYLPQTVPVQVAAADAPAAGGGRLTPNPVFAKLEPAAKKKKAAPKTAAAKPKPVVEADATPAPMPAAASPWPPR